MRRILLLSAALVTSVAFGATPEMGNGYGAIDARRDVDPVTLAERFCDLRIHHGDMAGLEPWFAPKLAKLLAEQADAKLAAVPWQGHADTPTSCTVEVLNGFSDTIGVLVRLHYTAVSRQWADTLNFERTRDSWRLNNVFYEGGGNLRFRLFNQGGG